MQNSGQKLFRKLGSDTQDGVEKAKFEELQAVLAGSTQVARQLNEIVNEHALLGLQLERARFGRSREKAAKKNDGLFAKRRMLRD